MDSARLFPSKSRPQPLRGSHIDAVHQQGLFSPPPPPRLARGQDLYVSGLFYMFTLPHTQTRLIWQLHLNILFLYILLLYMRIFATWHRRSSYAFVETVPRWVRRLRHFEFDFREFKRPKVSLFIFVSAHAFDLVFSSNLTFLSMLSSFKCRRPQLVFDSC